MFVFTIDLFFSKKEENLIPIEFMLCKGLTLFTSIIFFGFDTIYPTLNPAEPNPFEKVLKINKFLYLLTRFKTLPCFEKSMYASSIMTKQFFFGINQLYFLNIFFLNLSLKVDLDLQHKLVLDFDL